MHLQKQHPRPQKQWNTRPPPRPMPKIPYPSYYNCYNQAENIRYEYADAQADFVAHQIVLQSKVAKLYRHVPMGAGSRQLDLAIKELKLGSAKCEIVGIDRKDQICRFYRMCQKGETIECQIYSQYQQSSKDELEQLLISLGIKTTYTKNTQPQLPIHHQLFWALRNLHQLINGQQPLNSCATLEGVKKLRIQLGLVYLQAMNKQLGIVNWNDWYKLTFQHKCRYLCKMNPLTPKQLEKATKMEGFRVESELSQMLKHCIQNYDSGMVKIILRIGVPKLFGIDIEGSPDKISFLTYTQKLIQSNDDETKQKQLTLIKKYLNKYGYNQAISKTNQSKTNLKVEETYATLKNVAKETMVDVKVYQGFYRLLKSHLYSKITGLAAAVSGQVQMTSGGTIDGILSTALSKVPYVGGILSDAYKTFVFVSEQARKEHLSRFFTSSSQIEQIINDYSTRIISHYNQQIINPIPKSVLKIIQAELNKKIKQFSVKFPVKHVYNVKGQERDYTVDWEILCRRYVGDFLLYLVTQHVTKKYTYENSLGIMAAGYLFQYCKLAKTDLQRIVISEKYEQINCLTFAKLSSYVSNIQRYPKSLSMGEDAYWLDSSLPTQTSKLQLKVKALVIASKNMIILSFYSDDQFELSSKVAELYGMKTSENLAKGYIDFVDNSMFIKNSHSSEVCFGKLMDDLINKYGSAKIFITGYESGGVLAAFTRLLLINQFRVPAHNVVSYSFGQLKWCHRDSIEKTIDLFKTHYQVYLNQAPLIRNASLQKIYVSYGSRLYLKSAQLNQNSMRDFIKILQEKSSRKYDGQKSQAHLQKSLHSAQISLNQSSPKKQLQKNQKQIKSFENVSEITIQNLLKYVKKSDFRMAQKFITVQRGDLKFYASSQNLEKVKDKFRKELYKLDIENQIFEAEPFKPEKVQNFFELQKESIKILKYFLLENIINPSNFTIKTLCYACLCNQPQLVKFCIEKLNISPNQCVDMFNGYVHNMMIPLTSTLIGMSRVSGDSKKRSQYFQILKYLVEVGKANVNFIVNHSDRQGSGTKILRKLAISQSTPMFYALELGDLEVIKYFVSKGCDVNSVNLRIFFTSYNALSLAIQYKNMFVHDRNSFQKRDQLGIVKYLVEDKKLKPKNLNMPGILNDGGIQFKPEIIHYLIQKGLNPNTTIQLFGIPIDCLLMSFIRKNNLPMVQYLVKKGADPNLNISGYAIGTPLHCVCCNFNVSHVYQYLNLNMLKFFLKNGGDLHIQIVGVVARFAQGSYVGRLNKTPLDFLFKLEKDKPQVRQYLDILRLQNKIPQQILFFQQFKATSQVLLDNQRRYYSICTFFVSEFIQIQDHIKTSSSIDKQTLYQKILIDKLKPDFFEGKEKLQLYNKAMYLLYSYYNPKRFDQALQICERYLKNQDDLDFLFLKCIIYLQLANGFDHEKKNFYKSRTIQIVQNLQSKHLKSYLQAQLAILDGNKEEALKYYIQSYNENNHFNYPQVKILKIMQQFGIDSEKVKSIDTKPNQLFRKIFESVSKQILPSDLQFIMREVYEKKYNTYSLTSATTNQEQDFKKALKYSFNIDVKYIMSKLQKVIPQKIFTLAINYQEDGKTEKLNVKKLLKQVNYAFQILDDGYGLINKFMSSQGLMPDSRESKFFEKLTLLIIKLQALKEAIQNKCYSRRDFKKQSDQTQCLQLIEILIEYYEDYIYRVILNYSRDQDSNYIKYFFKSIGRTLDVNQKVGVYTQMQLGYKTKNPYTNFPLKSYLLNQAVSSALTIGPPSTDQIYGTHKVIVLPNNNSNQVFYKYEPYAPGIEFAVGSLYKLILPNSTPETMLIKLTDGKKSGLYLASKAIVGRNFAQTINQPQFVNLIDMKNFSGMFFSSLLVCTGDAKPDNFVMHFNYDKKGLVSTELISIDNDIAFYRGKLKANPNNQNLYSDMLNILYLMPQMDQPISPYLRQYLCRAQNQPQIIVSKWLGSLHKKNKHYLSMKGFTEQDLKKLKLPIKLPSGTACMVYSLLSKITSLLKSSSITHSQIFKIVSPSLAYFYNKCRDNTSMVNSLKNLYVAAGADPSILASLYSLDKIRSTNAWNTMSASKRKNQSDYHNLFNSEISFEAQSFISTIDFTHKDEHVIEAIKNNLNFVKDLILHNISDINYEKLFHEHKFSELQHKKIVKNQPKSMLKKTSTKQDEKKENNLEINSIWQLLTLPQIPKSQQLIQAIKIHKININALDNSGETILHALVRSAIRKQKNERAIGKLIKILLDCGINTKVKNNKGESILDIAISVPHIILTIFDYKPTFFHSLIRNGLIQEAEIIAKSISFDSCVAEMQSELVGNQSTILRDFLQNKQLKTAAMLVLKKQQDKHLFIDDQLLSLFILNYDDKDIDLLELLLKSGANPSSHNRQGIYPAQLALKLKKYNFALMLLNQGGIIDAGSGNKDLRLISKAAEYRIKLDINDLLSKFDIKKTNSEGNTLLHLMAQSQDKDIAFFEQQVRLYQNYKSTSTAKTLEQIALQVDFIQLLEIIYRNGQNGLYQQNRHKLSKDQNIGQLSQLLKQYGFGISIRQARLGIDFYSHIDKKGNNILHLLVKEYIAEKSEQTMQKIYRIVQSSEKNFINWTASPDGNTILHLLIRSKQTKCAMRLWQKYPQKIDLSVRNSLGQSIIQYAIQQIGQNIFGSLAIQQYKQAQKLCHQIQAHRLQDMKQILPTISVPWMENMINVFYV